MKGFSGIEQTLSVSQLIIDGLLADPQLIKVTEPYGYTKKSFQQAKAQWEHTRMLFHTKDECYQDKKHATQQLKTARYELRQVYLRHSGMLRAFYRTDPAVQEQLRLKQPTPVALDPFLTRVQRFYSSVLTLLEKTIGFPFTEEEVARAQAMIGAINEARVQQMSKKREAQRTTQQQREALQELRQWVRDFLVIAKIAFRHDLQQLEALGIVVKAA